MTAVVTVVFTSCPTRGGQQRNQFKYTIQIRSPYRIEMETILNINMRRYKIEIKGDKIVI